MGQFYHAANVNEYTALVYIIQTSSCPYERGSGFGKATPPVFKGRNGNLWTSGDMKESRGNVLLKSID